MLVHVDKQERADNLTVYTAQMDSMRIEAYISPKYNHLVDVISNGEAERRIIDDSELVQLLLEELEQSDFVNEESEKNAREVLEQFGFAYQSEEEENSPTFDPATIRRTFRDWKGKPTGSQRKILSQYGLALRTSGKKVCIYKRDDPKKSFPIPRAVNYDNAGARVAKGIIALLKEE